MYICIHRQKEPSLYAAFNLSRFVHIFWKLMKNVAVTLQTMVAVLGSETKWRRIQRRNWQWQQNNWAEIRQELNVSWMTAKEKRRSMWEWFVRAHDKSLNSSTLVILFPYKRKHKWAFNGAGGGAWHTFYELCVWTPNIGPACVRTKRADYHLYHNYMDHYRIIPLTIFGERSSKPQVQGCSLTWSVEASVCVFPWVRINRYTHSFIPTATTHPSPRYLPAFLYSDFQCWNEFGHNIWRYFYFSFHCCPYSSMWCRACSTMYYFIIHAFKYALRTTREKSGIRSVAKHTLHQDPPGTSRWSFGCIHVCVLANKNLLCLFLLLHVIPPLMNDGVIGKHYPRHLPDGMCMSVSLKSEGRWIIIHHQ